MENYGEKVRCRFLCMVTKAVHLEMVESLSTEDFIEAFRNFTGIRGRCERLWSDNGKNFVGVERELQKMVCSWNDSEMGQRLQKLWNGMAVYNTISSTSRRIVGSRGKVKEVLLKKDCKPSSLDWSIISIGASSDKCYDELPTNSCAF